MKNKKVYLNENLLSKAQNAWEKGKLAWQNWREKRRQERKEAKHERVWYYWRDAIASYAGDVYEIPAFTYGAVDVVSDEPLIFEFPLFTYDENDARAGTRTFRYTMPDDWETNEDSEVTDGMVEEVTDTIKESKNKKNMKKVIRLTEADLTRIVRRTIKEMEEDEPLGSIDRGEEILKELIEEARDILENELGFDLEEINEMSEWEMVDILYKRGYVDIASEMDELLDQEGFYDADADQPYDSIGGLSPMDIKRKFDDVIKK